MQISVVTDLFTFLGDDATDNRNETCFFAAVLGEDSLGDWEDAEYDICEGLCEKDGGFEVCDWEVVLARLDGFVSGVCECTIYREDVK